MALILAVDPERRQHAALECLARELDGHELLSASSCADALAALDRRSPDLVLLPLLLPEAEGGELLARLREHAGGSDVRALSIPLLKLPDAKPPPTSAHPAWLDQILHPKDDADGAAEECEPAVFADLIRGYLESARDAAAEALAAAAELAKAAAEATARAPGGGGTRHGDLGPGAARDVECRAGACRRPAGRRSRPKPGRLLLRTPPVAAASTFRFETAAKPVADFRTLPAYEFGSNDFLSEQPEADEVKGPGIAERAAALLAKLGALRTLGPQIVRWLPQAAVVAVVLTLGVSGRAYWLKTVSAPKVGVAVLAVSSERSAGARRRSTDGTDAADHDAAGRHASR